ncbi:MAG TPA: 2-hydroxychromene-2-carboxylate isomerase [Thermohalobaculum sp.]|nr:2-hydroxychromene-2-carboxylate isomerase [Thermohalobaculum sp.]
MGQGSIEYFYSVRSSFTYLGAARLNALARKHGLTIIHRPMDLLKLVDALSPVGDAHPADRPYAGARVYERCPVRERYTQIEYRRWGAYLGLAINVDPVHHNGPRALPSGVVIYCQAQGLDADAVSHAVLQALWRDDRDIADPVVVADILDGLALGVPGATICAEAMTPAVQAQLAENTRIAAEKGVFGAPTYLYRDEPFFGQDRLDFL